MNERGCIYAVEVKRKTENSARWQECYLFFTRDEAIEKLNDRRKLCTPGLEYRICEYRRAKVLRRAAKEKKA